MKEVFKIEVIISEMQNGNFSFLILVVGFLQLIVMMDNNIKNKRK